MRARLTAFSLFVFCAVLNVASYNSSPNAVAIILSAVIAREVWRIRPQWTKRRHMLGQNKFNATAVDPDDFVSLPAIAGKLKILFDKIMHKVDRSMKQDNTEVSLADLIAFLKMLGQLGFDRAVDRDRRYTECGEQVDDPSKVLEGLDMILDFACLAYEPDIVKLRDELKRRSFTLLRHDKVDVPGSVDHYIAMSKETKQIVVGIKGSASFKDLLTDCVMQARSYKLRGPFVMGGKNEITVHEGISLATRRLADDLEELAAELLLPTRYCFIITGHSLGGSVAALLGMVLRSRLGKQYPKLLTDDGSILKVVAFASPPVLDHDAALACAPFTTTIINNSDIIPRTSLANLLIFMEYLKTVNRKLEERKMVPRDLPSTFKYIKMIMSRLEGGRSTALLSIEEVRSAMQEAYAKVDVHDPDHLYVPGRVIQMYDLWTKEGFGAKGKAKQVAAVNGDDQLTAQSTNYIRAAERVHMAYGTSNVLRYIEVCPRMIEDHCTDSYKASIRDLLAKVAV